MTEYQYKKIRENIWHIEDDNGVFCTLVKGTKLAMLVDTGYGERNLRLFIEENIDTPYIVVNSHGHPDHVLGDLMFEEIYANKEEWDVIEHFIKESKPEAHIPKLNEISIGQIIDLGGIHAEIISMEGHTKGAVGILIEEEELLIAGDSINSNLWMFNYGSLKLSKLQDMLKRLLDVPFKTFICGHSATEHSKNMVLAHLKNLEQITIDEDSKDIVIGFEVYSKTYEGKEGKSTIVFAKELVDL